MPAYIWEFFARLDRARRERAHAMRGDTRRVVDRQQRLVEILDSTDDAEEPGWLYDTQPLSILG